METVSIYRPCFGATPCLGDFYDATTDALCFSNLFGNKISKECIRTEVKHVSEHCFLHSDSYREKFDALDVPGEMQLSILANMVIPMGGGQYLSHRKQSARTVQTFLVVTSKTVVESLNFLDTAVLAKIKADGIEGSNVTHVVQEITWGATVVISCTRKRTEKFNKDEQGQILYFKDIPLRKGELPSKMNEMMDFAMKVPCLVSSYNNGKGVPQGLRLIPIQQLQILLGSTDYHGPFYRPVDEIHVGNMVDAFDRYSEGQQTLHDFYLDAIRFKYAIHPKQLKDISELYEETTQAAIRSKLAHILTEVRSGSCDVDKLDKLANEIKEAAAKSTEKLSKWSEVSEKMQIARVFEEHGIEYVGVGGSLESELWKTSPEQNSVLLYFCQKWIKEEPERWTRNLRLFLNKSEEKEGNEHLKLFAVDCEFQESSKILGTCVHVLSNINSVVVDDLLATEVEKK